MKVVPKACDDMMQVGRLQNFEGNLNAQGRLLFQGTLQISDGGPNQPFRGKERRVFLFEQSAIIADCIPPRKEYGNPTYIFKNQIMVNKMVLDENVPDEPLRFILTSNDPSQPAVFVAQTASIDDKEKWLQKLSAQLDQQKTFLAALVDPKKYQNQLASSVGSLSLSGKKDSSSSLGTPSGAQPATSPKHNTATATKSSSKLFGFGKSKS
uniref:PH domain-containing protein n=1 Tax=Ditylenchus dipsaci TaxID=166011 RepID=A0A915CLG7_9BILA